MALRLAGSDGTNDSEPGNSSSGDHVLEVADGDEVTLTVTSSGAAPIGDVTWTVDGKPVPTSTPVATADPQSDAIAVTVAGKGRHGRYSASETRLDGSRRTSNSVSLKPAERNGEPDGDAGGAIEIGGVDRPFALALLGVMTFFAAAIIWITWRTISRIALPASTVMGDDETVFGTWAERSESFVQIVALGGGLVVLLVGAWLAAIETRGRLRIPTEAVGINTKTGERSPLDAESAEAIGIILSKARRLRGALAVVVAGVLVVGFAVWGASGT